MDVAKRALARRLAALAAASPPSIVCVCVCVGVTLAGDAGCTSDDPAPRAIGGVDGGGATPDAAAPADAGADGAPPTGDAGDAGALTLHVYPRTGSAIDDPGAPNGPGMVLMGGGADIGDAFVWAHDTIAGSPTRTAGDVVVLRASGDDAYDPYIHGLAPFNSVRTILLAQTPTPADYAAAAAIVAEAEMVWFAGGDQAKYVRWKGSPLMKAVAGVYARGGVVGGTSAGAMIQGAFTFDALNAISESVTSAVALADPFDPKISLTKHVVDYGPASAGLGDALVDVHFAQRGRFGRTATFLARAISDGMVDRAPARALGVALDEGVALLVDKTRTARVVRGSGATTDAAHFLRATPAARVTAKQPLLLGGVVVTRLDDPSQSFDLERWCGTGPTFTVDVDGGATPPYTPASPYGAPGPLGTCP